MEKYKIIFLMALLFAAFIYSKAQGPENGMIKGSLSDEQGKALSSATVVLKKAKDSSICRTALSDEKGVFLIGSVEKGNYFLEISMQGFVKEQKSDLSVDEAHPVADLGLIVLKNAARLLQDVIIRGDLPLIERQIDRTVVNVAQNITNDGVTVLELMQKLPGVQVTPDGQISMNGKSGVKVYIDGKPTYLSAEDLANLLTGMPASNIQKIEIMSNPSSRYDAAGTGGIINIIRKKNRKEGWNGSITGSPGQGYYDKYNGGFTISYKNEKYSLFLNNSYSYNKSYFNKTVISDILNADGSLSAEQASDNDAINASRTYRPTVGIDLYLSKKTTLALSGMAGLGSSSEQTLSGMDVSDSVREKTNHIHFISGIQDKPFNYSAGMQLSHAFDSLGRAFTIDIDHAYYRNDPVQNNLDTLEDAHNSYISETDALLLQHRRLEIYAAKADYVQPLANKTKLETGVKWSYVKANNDNSYYDQVSGQNIVDSAQSDYSVNSELIDAAYVNINKTFHKLTVQAGLRAEQTISNGKQLLTGEVVDQNYVQVFPTLFFDYKLDENHRFNIQSGRRTERAAYSEMVPFRRPQTATLFFQGNPNLRPQTSWHAELTWAYQNAFSVTLSYDIFRDYIRTLPFLDSNKITITRMPINIQGAHSWEVDFGYSKKLTGCWSTDNTLSIYQNAFNGEADHYSLDNAGLASVYFSADNSFQIGKNLSAECNFEYNSKRQYVTSTFGPYSVLSFAVKQVTFHNKGSVSINAHNILQSESHNAIDRNNGLYQYSYWNFHTRWVSLNLTYRLGSGKTGKARVNSASADEQNRAGN